MDFSKFDSMVDAEKIKREIEKAATFVPGEYVEVPHGLYEVKIDQLELKESSKGDPMVSAWFRIVRGEYEDSIIFMNQVVKKGFQIHLVNQFIRGMRLNIDMHFESYSQYARLLQEVFLAVDGHKEFALDYKQNDKGYNTYEIVDVFDL